MLEHGAVPSVFKSAYLTTLLKKSDLDPADANSHLTISNLSVTLKLLERVVSKQLVKYLKDNDLLPDHQSVYRVNRSTETTVLKVPADILLALDSRDLAMLTLLDLSAAFDCVDHDAFPRRLQISYERAGVVINWFSLYLHGRLQHVRVQESGSHRRLWFCMVYSKGRASGRPISFIHQRSATVHQTLSNPSTRLR